MEFQMHSSGQVATRISPESVVEYISQHPNCQVNDIASHFGVTYACVLQKLKPSLESGVVERRKILGERYSPFGHFVAEPVAVSSESAAEAPTTADLVAEAFPIEEGDVAESSFLLDAINLSVDKVFAQLGPLADSLAVRAATVFKQRFADTFAREVANIEIPDTESLLPQKEKRLRICVVGTQSMSTADLQREFKNELILDCIDAAEMRKIQRSPKFAHATVLMTDHVSHKAKQAIEASGIKPIYVNGGLSSLKSKLEEIYANS